jgi:hypothetical protein
MFSTATIPTATILRIHSQAAALAADPTTLPTMAAMFRLGEELVPDPDTLRMFHQWLADEFDALTREVCVAWVNREVPLTEAVAALRGPLLPGETHRTLPVSTLGTASVAGLMTAQQNLQFRAVHDAMHAKLGSDDSWEGELATTLGHLATSAPQIWPILASEVAGQASVAIFEGEFPEQRLSANCLSPLAWAILGA